MDEVDPATEQATAEGSGGGGAVAAGEPPDGELPREELDPEELDRLLAGGQAELRWLVDWLTPVIQTRVVRLLSNQATGCRSLRQELEDLTQEVFMSLFADRARVLRSWQPQRGASLRTFVSLVAERRVYSLLRSARSNPWTADPRPAHELAGRSREVDPERRAASRDELRWLLDRLCARLTPLGRRMFEYLFVDERSLEEIGRETGLSQEAIYAWRSRLRRLAVRLDRGLEPRRAARPARGRKRHA